MKIIDSFNHGGYTLYYLDADGVTCMQLLPAGMSLAPEKKAAPEPLLHAFVSGDDFGGQFTAGLSMRKGQTTQSLKTESITREGDAVVTRLSAYNGMRFEHRAEMLSECVKITVTARNASDAPKTLENLTSFAMGGITPLCDRENPGSLKLVRLRSYWSEEARPDRVSLEQLNLEPAPPYNMDRVEKFGCLGSMPVRGFYPRTCVEDTMHGVTWGFDLDAPASWQMEVVRKDRGVSVTGGLGDYDFAHWRKTLAPGESFTAPSARITVCRGNADRAFQILCRALRNHASSPVDRDMPIIYNEFCTTGGNPLRDNIKQIADRLRGMGLKYLVVDAGWFVDIDADWGVGDGDWLVSRQRFPGGLKEVCDYIRDAGMIPGLWFEMEVAGPEAEAWNQTEHLLKRNGNTLTVFKRRFWDFRDEWVKNYLRQKVISQLKDNGIGFIKVDYNDSVGMGCDGAESPGEGLRQHIQAVKEFFAEIRREVPDIVIENCSSGGHRQESSFMSLCDMASSSDCMEADEVPVIAANLQRAILPEQSEIWAVLRASLSEGSLKSRLIQGMYGRLCVSGEIYDLSEEQWRQTEEGFEFYRAAAPIIKDGETLWLTGQPVSYREIDGRQVTMRINGNEALLLCHRFALQREESCLLPGNWRVKRRYGSNAFTFENNTVTALRGSIGADAWLLERV